MVFVVWYICSAAGGTGKTELACALAEKAADRGGKPVLLDAAGRLHACIARMNADGVVTCLTDVLEGTAKLSETLYSCPYKGILLAVASFETPPCIMEYVSLFPELRSLADPLIVDTGTGEEGPDPDILQDGDRVLVLAWPDENGLRQAARRVFSLEENGAHCDLALNCVPKERHMHDRLRILAEEITGRKPGLFIPQQAQTDKLAIKRAFQIAANDLLSGVS